MSNNDISKPVTILTGFLGAGKTTFLNYHIEKNKEKRYAIIENEYGEQGIDNDLIIQPDETIVTLNNGCLCCTLNENLYDILNELHDRRSEFDEVIIEATGVADPTGLAQPFIVHPLIRKHFPLISIICLVDAELVLDQLSETEEAKQQIAYSDILLITKTDLVSADHVSYVTTQLRKMNPLASIVCGNKDNYPAIHNKRNNDFLDKTLLQAQTDVDHAQGQMSFPVEKPHSHHHHTHTDEINSVTVFLDHPLDLRKLNLNLSVYLTFQAESLYRMKGIVWLAGEKHKIVLQSVGNRFDLSEHALWSPQETKRSVIVFIGKNIKRKGVELMLNRCLDKSTNEAPSILNQQ